MKTKIFLPAVLAIAAGLSMASSALAITVSGTTMLNVYYDPATGNIKLQNTTSGTQSFQSFDVLTIGNGSYGPPSGLPSNVGYLSTGTANLPVGTPNPTQPTNPNGLNGLYSEAAAYATGAAVMTLNPFPGWSETPGNQIGPVGSYWDLGNIAITGMSQADLDLRFLSPSDLTPSGLNEFGTFLFSYQTGPTTFSVTIPGGVLAVVPEPSTIALAAVAATIGGVGAVSKRRKNARMNAKRLSANA